MVERYAFKELIDIPALQQLTDDLYTATGIPSAIITMDGEVLTGSGWQRICTDFHRQHPEIELDCITSDTAIRKAMDDGEEFVIYECPRGLVDACSPVIIEGEHVANVFAGQLFMTPHDDAKENFFRQSARKYGLDETAYLDAYREIPVLPEAKFRPALSFLSRFAKLVASIGLARLRERDAMQQIAVNERKYQRLLESTSTIPWELDLATREFAYIGPQAVKILGYPISYWRQVDDWVAATHEDDRAEALEFSKKETARGADYDFTYRMIAQDGKTVWIHDVVTVINGPNGPEKLAGFLHDITEQTISQLSQIASSRRLESLIRTAMDGFWVVDLKGRFLQVNETYCKMSGYSEQELLTMTIPDIEAIEDAENTAAHIQQLISAGQGRFESRHRRKDGSEFEVEVSTQFQSWDEAVFVAFVRDITEIKAAEAERQEMEAKLQQAQRMEAVGTLAGGIAHDFNNILGAILGYTELTLTALPLGSDERENLQEVVVASNRAQELVKQILNFSRAEDTERILVEPAGIVIEAMGLLRSTIPKSIEFVQEFDAGAGFVFAAPSQIHQLVMNLCTNAYSAMRETGGTLTVQVSSEEINGENEIRFDDLKPGMYVKIVVSDTGRGMDRPTLDRIFEPYFTTRMFGEGTGLGLSVVHGIVKSLEGTVMVDSTPGVGTTFTIFLPRRAEAPAVFVAPRPAVLPGHESVLFVDDEPAIARLGRKMLESLGYTVRDVTDSHEALRLFESDPDGFDVIVTDQTMPGLSGSELVRRARLIRPNIPAAICTGYSDVLDEAGTRAIGVAAFAMKPYNRSKLATMVQTALGKEA